MSADLCAIALKKTAVAPTGFLKSIACQALPRVIHEDDGKTSYLDVNQNHCLIEVVVCESVDKTIYHHIGHRDWSRLVHLSKIAHQL